MLESFRQKKDLQSLAAFISAGLSNIIIGPIGPIAPDNETETKTGFYQKKNPIQMVKPIVGVFNQMLRTMQAINSASEWGMIVGANRKIKIIKK